MLFDVRKSINCLSLRFALVMAVESFGGINVCFAQQDGIATLPPLSSLPAWASAQSPPKKRALLIGINDYVYAKKLTTPKYDMKNMFELLEQVDPAMSITIVPADRLDRGGLLKSIDEFSKTLGPGEIAIVFFSGHGIERDGVNYIVPIDAGIAERGREGFVYLSVPYLIDKVHNSGAGLAILLLDACRVDPFIGADIESDILPQLALSASVGNMSEEHDTNTVLEPVPVMPSPNEPPPRAGLSVINAPQGFIVAFAAEPGKPSYSLFKGDSPSMGSIFTRRFISRAGSLNLPINAVLNATGGDVFDITGNKQKPFVNSFNAGELLLLSNNNLAKNEEETWIRTINGSYPGGLLSGLRQFISVYPAGPFTSAARRRIQELSRPPVAGVRLIGGKDVEQPFVLSGALGTPAVGRAGENIAVVRRDANFRSAPYSSGSKVIGVLKKNEEIMVLATSTREGWAKVIRGDGQVGYVGSVNSSATPKGDSLQSIDVKGDEAVNLTAALKSTANAPASTVQIDASVQVDDNPWKARQSALLRALRVRASLVTQGVSRDKISIELGSKKTQLDPISISVMRGELK